MGVFRHGDIERMKYLTKDNELFSKIQKYINGKRVLDVGFIEHKLEKTENNPNWVHSFLKRNSRFILGIDILEKEVKELKKKGYNAVVGNAETFNLNEKFDVIFAGELIEHLSNPGLFLDNCRKHLSNDGILILTTPNAFSTRILFRCLRTNQNNPVVNSQHTCYYTPTTITEIITRAGLDILKIDYFDPRKASNLKYLARSMIEKIRGNHTKESMLVFASLRKK